MIGARVSMKQSTMVRPAEETPKRTLWLSSLDMIPASPQFHIPVIYIYHQNHHSTDHSQKETSNKISRPNFFDPTLLKESLAKVLVPFYPVAGRLKMGEVDSVDRLEIDCNGEGVLFIEAEIKTHSLADFGDFKPTPELKKLLIPSCDYSRGLSSFPLFMVQLTRFSCGGVTLCCAINHHVCDGYGFAYLTNSWARLARGLDLEFMPVHERTGYLSPRNPPQVKFQHLEYDPPKGLLSGDSQSSVSLGAETLTQSFFKLTKNQVNGLKQKATPSKIGLNLKLSTYEVIAGHIWRTACKARGLAEDQEVRLYLPTNGRFRLKNPALPQGYCGNVVFYPACIAKSGDITGNPLWYAANKIHETMEKGRNEEYLRSSIDYLETHPNVASLVRGQHTVRYTGMEINSWEKLGLYEADFGWGRPSFVGHGGISREGGSVIMPSPSGDGGFSVCVGLLSHHMVVFEKYFYDFDTAKLVSCM